jgi:hypothetical protein
MYFLSAFKSIAEFDMKWWATFLSVVLAVPVLAVEPVNPDLSPTARKVLEVPVAQKH